MNNTDWVYVGWVAAADLETHHENIKVFTHKHGARKWVNEMNRRNPKTFLMKVEKLDDTTFTIEANYTEAGFDELMVDRESK